MRLNPSAEVNSVMMRPQPETSFEVSMSTSLVIPVDCVVECAAAAEYGAAEEYAEYKDAFLMKRRKTVSVTPAIGARTVAGAMRTLPMRSSAGTLASAGISRSIVDVHFLSTATFSDSRISLVAVIRRTRLTASDFAN